MASYFAFSIYKRQLNLRNKISLHTRWGKIVHEILSWRTKRTKEGSDKCHLNYSFYDPLLCA